MADTSDISDMFADINELGPQQQPEVEAALSEIDIEALAEKVYRLMLAEIRLDRARGLSFGEGV